MGWGNTVLVGWGGEIIVNGVGKYSFSGVGWGDNNQWGGEIVLVGWGDMFSVGWGLKWGGEIQCGDKRREDGNIKQETSSC